jgi:hypothetical protein
MLATQFAVWVFTPGVPAVASDTANLRAAPRPALPQSTNPAASSQPATTRPFDPTSDYRIKTIQGWPVRVNQRLAAQGELVDTTLSLLEHKLYDITRVVPAPALVKLRQVPIWVELEDPPWGMACYHPSADWLREHGYNPDKAGAVENTNARNFLAWTLHQPSAVLHELAHAYHHQVLKYDHPAIRRCCEQAVASKTYESVLNYAGQHVRAYALENDQEYFAELSESFFGTNDFYPFVRAELKEHDPDAYQMLGELWGVKE